MQGRRWALGAAGAAVALAGVAYLADRAEADGVPQTSPFTYSGTLLSPGTGDPIAGPVNLVVSLWNDPSGGSQLCTTIANNTPLVEGRFQVTLTDPACATAVHNSPNLYVNVSVNGTNLLPRPKLGATPYALEADRATRTIYVSNGERYSVGGGYCGSTAPTNGDINGYAGAKAVCEQVAGCSSSAHMCTSDELVRHVAMGNTNVPAGGWYASGTYGLTGTSPAYPINDCQGYQTAIATITGSVTTPTAGGTIPGSWLYCDDPAPVLCCD